MPPFTLLERYASLICFKFQGASSCLQDLVLSEFFQFESCFWANFFDDRCLFHVFLAVARSKHHFARCRAGHCKVVKESRFLEKVVLEILMGLLSPRDFQTSFSMFH